MPMGLRGGGPEFRRSPAAEDPDSGGHSTKLRPTGRNGEERDGMNQDEGRDLRRERKCLEGEGMILGSNFRPSTERFHEPAIGRGLRSKQGKKGSGEGGKEWKWKEGERDRRKEMKGWR